MPEASDDGHGGGGVPLEEFLAAIQKSLARAAASSAEAGKSDNEFTEGERPLYGVDAIDIDLNAGIALASPQKRGGGDKILLDLGVPAELRSRLRFRVESRAVEILSGAKLELADLDPLREDFPRLRLRVWLVDPQGAPVPNHDVVLHFARAGDRHLREKEQIPARTDVVGRVDFYIESDKAERNVKVVGVRRRATAHILGSARGVGRDEFYLWATCPRPPEWDKVVEPAAPRPPQAFERDEKGRPVELTSPLLRMRI